jgi:hypothetical protein
MQPVKNLRYVSAAPFLDLGRLGVLFVRNKCKVLLAEILSA